MYASLCAPGANLGWNCGFIQVEEPRVVIAGRGEFLVSVIQLQRALALRVEVGAALDGFRLDTDEPERRIIAVVNCEHEPAG